MCAATLWLGRIIWGHETATSAAFTATSGAALPRAPFVVHHAPKNRYPLSRDLREWASPTEGSKPASDTHKSSLHFFILLEVSAVRSDRKNQQPLLTTNSAVALPSSAGYSIGTW